MIQPQSFEADVQRFGRQIFQMSKARQSRIKGGWWNSKLMEFALRDPALKIQLFRFVDVLPALRSNKEIGRHLDEYFNAPGHAFPSFLSWGASLAAFSSLAAMAGAIAVRKSVEDMARTFISGRDAKEAIPIVEGFRKGGMGFTLDLLGEAVVSEKEADFYAQKYHEILDALAKVAPKWKPDAKLDSCARGPIPRINLSVKLSSLYSQIDPIDPADSIRGIERRLVPLLEKAKAMGAFVNVDMEDYHLKELTLAIFRTAAMRKEFRDWPDLGIVLQAYLKEGVQDVEQTVAFAKQRGTPFTVRLVKGAYWDYETIHAQQHGWPCPVYTDKHETDASFEACALKLLEGYPHVELALGSHNVRSVAFAMAAARALNVPQNGYEIQTLYGMARHMKDALTEEGYRTRIYTPFGELIPGMAYLVRRLLENTANESFLRQGFVENISEEKLLENPAAFIVPKTPEDPTATRMLRALSFQNEPESAFFHEEVRVGFDRALEAVRGQLGEHYPLVIGGKSVEGKEPKLESRDPSDRSRLVGTVAMASVHQADEAVAAARAAFPAWSAMPVADRADYLRKAAVLMRGRKHEYAAWEIFEEAKPRREADGDLAEAVDFLEYYATEAEKVMAVRRRAPVPGEVDEDFHQPRGVAAVIAPWNFPLAILTGMTAAALVTGNTVVMKPAEQSPIVAAMLMEVFEDVGLPPGVLNYLPGKGESVGARLVEHPGVSVIAFTGSKAVGLAINAAAAATREGQQGVKKVICEMGGKNAVIVDSDANLDEAVTGVIHSAFGYAGQKCSACSRAIVVGDAYEPFVERVTEAAQSLRVLPAENPGCFVPPVIDDEARDRVQRFIERGKKEAKLAAQVDASDLAKKGSFVGPAVFVDVPPKASIAQEEIFGPVLAVMKAETFEQAMELALDVPYALTGGLYSRSPANIAAARERFRVGNLYINRGITGAKVSRQPFGGFKMSGIGSKAGGPEYLLQFVEPRTVTENTMRRGFAPPEKPGASG